MSKEKVKDHEWDEICKAINYTENPLYKYILKLYTLKVCEFVTLIEEEDVGKYETLISKDGVVAINILKRECEGKELKNVDYKKVYKEIDEKCCRFISAIYKEALLIET